jgi:hypothetical protein
MEDKRWKMVLRLRSVTEKIEDKSWTFEVGQVQFISFASKNKKIGSEILLIVLGLGW